MPHAIKRFVLTPTQAAEKALILDQIRVHPVGPWVNGKKISLPKAKTTSTSVKKEE